jgi:hypothetical protein
MRHDPDIHRWVEPPQQSQGNDIMATLITGTVNEQVLTADTTYIVTQSAVVTGTTNAVGIEMSSNNELFVAGLVEDTNDVIVRVPADINAIVRIAPTGMVIGTGQSSDAIDLQGDNADVTVAGDVFDADYGVIFVGASQINARVTITETSIVQGGEYRGDTGADAAAIGSTADNTLIENNGTIIADVNEVTGLRLAVTNTLNTDTGHTTGLMISIANEMTLLNTGSILGDIYMAASNDDLINSGTISGVVDMGADSDDLSNSGTITGGGSGAETLRNSGTITSDSDGIDSAGIRVRILNSGTVTGKMVGIIHTGDSAHITNTGTIYATDSIAAVLFSDNGHLINSGTIESASRAAVELGVNGGTNMVTLVNTGTLIGGAEFGEAVTGDAGVQKVVNSGAIFGDVILSHDNDIYNGRGGTVEGTIDGGAGEDTLLGGSLSDEMYGGNGDDDLDGGAGGDTLRGGRGEDDMHQLRCSLS